MTIVLLITVGVLEAAVWLWRLRAGVGESAVQAAFSAGAVCILRVMFTALNVQVAMAGDVWLGGSAYCISASLATLAAHKVAKTRKDESCAQNTDSVA